MGMAYTPTLLSGLMGVSQKTPSYRKIFPSYDWDEDVWRVNQIIKMPAIVGKEKLGFVSGVPNEEAKKSDATIKRWIDDNLKGCSCMIVFCGEKTAQSRWVKYEIEQARILNMGRFIVELTGRLDKNRQPCKFASDPYSANNKYCANYSPSAYTIRRYNWNLDNGQEHISEWIEDAIQRVRK